MIYFQFSTDWLYNFDILSRFWKFWLFVFFGNYVVIIIIIFFYYKHICGEMFLASLHVKNIFMLYIFNLVRNYYIIWKWHIFVTQKNMMCSWGMMGNNYIQPYTNITKADYRPKNTLYRVNCLWYITYLVFMLWNSSNWLTILDMKECSKKVLKVKKNKKR